MFTAHVYNIMIGAPSDMQVEIAEARNAIEQWNQTHAAKMKIVLLPRHWSFSSYLASGADYAQQILNKQLVEPSDMLICFFGTKLGTPTDTEISGTVEEINEHLKAKKQVMTFFRTAVDDITTIDVEQLQLVRSFKEKLKGIIWHEYKSTEQLRKELYTLIERQVKDHFIGYSENTQIQGNVLNTKSNFVLSKEEYDILRDWVNSGEQEAYRLNVLGGSIFMFGRDEYQADYGEAIANYEDFIEKLLNVGMIILYSYDKEGNPIYKLKKSAYTYVREREK